MKFKNKIIWLGILIIIVFISLQFLLIRQAMEKNLEALQMSEALTHMQKIDREIGYEDIGLASKARNWASWDDMYNYIIDRNDYFIKSNMNKEVMSNFGISFLIIANNSREIVFSVSHLTQGNENNELIDYFNYSLMHSKLFTHEKVNSSLTGIINTPQGLFLISSMPILTNEMNGPIRGTLIMGIPIDDDFLYRISVSENRNMQMLGLENLKNQSMIYSSLLSDGTYYTINEDHSFTHYHLIRDIFGDENIVIKISMDNQGYLDNQVSLMNFYRQLLLILIVGSLVLYVIINQLLKKRGQQIDELKKFAQQISSGNYGLNIPIHSKDEIGDISKYLNDMKDNIVQTNEMLNKESKELKMLSKELSTKVDKKTAELEQKLIKEEKATKAMIYILERAKKTNEELNLKKAELDDKNRKLIAAEKEIIKDKEGVEQLVIERTKELKRETEKVEKLLTMKTELINQLSHDLRTPITPLNTLLPLVYEHEQDPEYKNHLDVCIRNTKNLHNLIVQTLNLSRLEQNKVEFNIKKLELLPIIQKTITDNEPVFKKANINPIIKIPEGLSVMADELRLYEIIQNIQNNSVKYSPDGGELIFDAEEKPDMIAITVTDQGIGLTRQNIDKLFNEFFKVDQARHEAGSVGLGLAICKRMIEKMGGKIWITSPGPKKGITTHFTLPKGKEDPKKKKDIHKDT